MKRQYVGWREGQVILPTGLTQHLRIGTTYALLKNELGALEGESCFLGPDLPRSLTTVIGLALQLL